MGQRQTDGKSGQHPGFSPFLYRFRNLVERFFNKPKHFRAVATRFEKHDANYFTLVKRASPESGCEPDQAPKVRMKYPWRCMPFAEGARYGIELFYPFEKELSVMKRDGRFSLDGDFGPDPEIDLQWPPFRTFGETYYAHQILLDLEVEPGWAIRTEPHPRFYTGLQTSTPIAVPALLRH